MQAGPTASADWDDVTASIEHQPAPMAALGPEPPAGPTRRRSRVAAFGSLRRKEDERFIRGQGRFLDDIALPSMMHGAVLRSPLAHARIARSTRRPRWPTRSVHAVLTGADLERQGMAWMPTLSHDRQAVLATDKVRFQGQEVAFVVADDHYSARDALELIDVEYEPLPVLVDPRRALDDDAPLIRDDEPGRVDNHVFDWEAGDRAACRRAFEAAESSSSSR